MSGLKLANWLRPDQYWTRLEAGPLQEILSRCDGLILDVDGTLLPFQKNSVSVENLCVLVKLADSGCLQRLCLLSNTIVPGRSNRIYRIAEQIRQEIARQTRKIILVTTVCCNLPEAKPRRSGFRQAAQALGSQPERLVMVGNNPFVDVVGARRAGIGTVVWCLNPQIQAIPYGYLPGVRQLFAPL